MATKLKNFLYNPGVKFLSVVIMLACVGVFTLCIVFMSKIGGPSSEDNYYQTYDFYREYNVLAIGAIEQHLMLKDEKTILDQKLDIEEQNKQIRRLRTIEDNQRDSTGFVYVLKNKETGDVFTNMSDDDPIEMIQSYPTSLYFEYGNVYLPEKSDMDDLAYGNKYSHYSRGEDAEYVYTKVLQGVLDILDEADARDGEQWQYYTAVVDPVPQSDLIFYDEAKQFDAYKKYDLLMMVGIISSAIIAGVILIYLVFVSGVSYTGREKFMVAYDEVPQELQTIITLTLLSPALWAGSTIDDLANIKTSQMLMLIALTIVFATAILIQYTSLIRQIRNKMFIKKLATYRFFAMILGLILVPRFDKKYRRKFIIWTTVWLLFNLLTFAVLIEVLIVGIILVFIVNSIALAEVFKLVDALRSIMFTIHDRRNGVNQEPFDLGKLPSSLKDFAQDLDALQEGLDVALEERLKGEKLKTELITNVTHDLKNPLTSIISYVALLKNMAIEDEEAVKYIQVLDEKANRLKGLIDQLVDASKASSGNVNVNMTTVELMQLTRQLCGEFEDKLAKKQLECVVPDTSDKYYVEADPMVLYRILENLMSNVSNYSLENTRVYLAISEEDKHVTYSIKNISKEVLNMTLDDLSQRFVRGDSSRNTEGSGLGISIALSLAKLMKSELKFDLDGDLFKATLRLKKMPAPVKVEVVDVEVIEE